MSRFTNKLCPVCRDRFAENADVVVCPECGTPHHRACYIKLGTCAVSGHHAKGFVWNGYLPDEQADRPSASAEKQQSANEHHATYPNNGTSAFPEIEGFDDQSFPNPYAEAYKRIRDMTSDETRGDDGVSSKELCHFAGKSVVHYAQAFSAFRVGIMRQGQIRPVKIFFNLCSGLFMPIHQFYRRMDLLAIGIMLFNALILVPDILLIYYPESVTAITPVLEMLSLLGSVAGLALTVLMCIFGDYLYYRFCVRRIKKIRAAYDDGKAEGYYEALTESGSPSKLRAVIGILATALFSQLVLRLPMII